MPIAAVRSVLELAVAVSAGALITATSDRRAGLALSASTLCLAGLASARQASVQAEILCIVGLAWSLGSLVWLDDAHSLSRPSWHASAAAGVLFCVLAVGLASVAPPLSAGSGDGLVCAWLGAWILVIALLGLACSGSVRRRMCLALAANAAELAILSLPATTRPEPAGSMALLVSGLLAWEVATRRTRWES